MAGKTLRTCKYGHQYYKSSSCLVCPKCEEERKSLADFRSYLSKPAKRALKYKLITTIEQLSQFTQSEILQLHGMGPSSLPKLLKALAAQELTVRKDK